MTEMIEFAALEVGVVGQSSRSEWYSVSVWGEPMWSDELNEMIELAGLVVESG